MSTSLRDRPHDADLDEDDAPRPSGLRRLGRLLGVVVGAAVLAAVLAFGVFPTQIYLDQRASISEVEQRLAVLRDQNDAYEDRIAALQTDEEIERLARDEYNMVAPGEEAYAVLPALLPPLELPELWPFGPMLDEPDEAGGDPS